MHHINVGSRHLGKSHQVVYPLGLDQRRAAFVVVFRAGLAGGEELLLKDSDQLRILAMGRGDHAQLPAQL